MRLREDDAISKKMSVDIAKLVGLSSLMAFTTVIIATAISAKGALIYYYEPNKFTFILEVFLGLYGLLMGWWIIWDICKGGNYGN